MKGRPNPRKIHPPLPALRPHRCRPGDDGDIDGDDDGDDGVVEDGDVIDGNEDGGVFVVNDNSDDHHVDKAIVDMIFLSNFILRVGEGHNLFLLFSFFIQKNSCF